jgi:undecaprenyl pyrophosphate phosphatase UppP
MLLFILKYIIVVTPLIIGLIINQVVNTTIFDPLTLVVGALIYPTTTLIVQWYFIRKENTKTA